MQFQELCQAIALFVMPDLQVLPTRQRDGGFDAFELGHSDGTKVFAKWVADQRQERDPVKWLEKVIAAETPNIQEMVRGGTKRWTLMTNVPGTSYPDSGTIDRLNRILVKAGQNLKLEMTAWWREDVSRRLSNVPWETKLAFPNMLVGFDAMRAVLFDAFRIGDRERLLRGANRRATDQDVRFKHGELEGVALQDIFLDVSVQQMILGSTAAERSDQVLNSFCRLASRPIGRFLVHRARASPPSRSWSLNCIAPHSLASRFPWKSFAIRSVAANVYQSALNLVTTAGGSPGSKEPLDPEGERVRPPGSSPSIEKFRLALPRCSQWRPGLLCRRSHDCDELAPNTVRFGLDETRSVTLTSARRSWLKSTISLDATPMVRRLYRSL